MGSSQICLHISTLKMTGPKEWQWEETLGMRLKWLRFRKFSQRNCIYLFSFFLFSPSCLVLRHNTDGRKEGRMKEGWKERSGEGHTPSPSSAFPVPFSLAYTSYGGFPSGSVGKEPVCNAGDTGHVGSIPGSGRCPEGKNGTPSSILARKIHGQRSLVGYSPWGCKSRTRLSD